MKCIDKFKDFKGKTDGKVKELIQQGCLELSKKWRLDARIRLANRWALHHPKKMVASTILIMLFLISTDFVASSLINLHQDSYSPKLNEVANIDEMMNGFKRIQNIQNNSREEYRKLVTKGQTLKHEFDSLTSLPQKSHEDSIEIITKYRQLEIITNNIK